jgi:hypothetical protein
MKTLSLWQPWAFLVMLAGHPDPEVARLGKRFETRSWQTTYRGQLAIHAAKYIPPEAKELCLTAPFQKAFEVACIKYDGDMPLSRILPCGVVLAITNMVDCQEITVHNIPPEPERNFGDYRPGRFMWHFQNTKPLPDPIPAVGRQSLWNWKVPKGVRLPATFSSTRSQIKFPEFAFLDPG